MSGDAAPGPGPATVAAVVRLRRRREFVAAARGAKQGGHAFLLQAVRRRGLGPDREAAAEEVGIGITVTRKIGGAVVRNRARRRLREALRQFLPGPARPGHDYVVVARPAALSQPFADLARDLDGAFRSVERRLARGRP